ncbi:MAG: hypothetical protein ABI867_12060 [Kofleriaceae bacterium]
MVGKTLVLAILVGAVTAASAGPPSKTLERAIKLYDKQDFYSSHVELTKVVTGESGDDVANKQRAEFFIGKTLYQLKYYVPAMAMFDKIAAAGSTHAYHRAVLKWYVALVDTLGYPMPALRTYDSKDVDDPAMESVRDRLRYLRGVLAVERGETGPAIEELGKVAKTSPLYRQAQLATAFARDQLATFATGDDIGDKAAVLEGDRLARAKQWDKAIAAYGRARPAGPFAKQAMWGASWARLAKLGGAGLEPYAGLALPAQTRELAGSEPPALSALLAVDYCAGKKQAPDGLASYRANAKAIDQELAKLVAFDDSAEFYEHVNPRALQALSKLTQQLVRTALASPRIVAAFAFVGELTVELNALSTADKAFQTTQGAAEILQELTVQQAIAQADAGKLARTRVMALRKDLAAALAAPAKLPVGGVALAPVCP